MDLEPVVEAEEAMELEQSEREEEVVEEKKGKNLPEELAEPHQAAETSEDAEQVTKTVSFLPRNKEELECLIKHIQDTVTVNILPKLHRCIVAKVRSCHWKGVLQGYTVTVKVGVLLQSQRKCSIWKKKRLNWRETMWKHKRLHPLCVLEVTDRSSGQCKCSVFSAENWLEPHNLNDSLCAACWKILSHLLASSLVSELKNAGIHLSCSLAVWLFSCSQQRTAACLVGLY